MSVHVLITLIQSIDYHSCCCEYRAILVSHHKQCQHGGYANFRGGRNADGI
jgi:hypothetical protein